VVTMPIRPATATYMHQREIVALNATNARHIVA
jgi:hypothetical protein